MSVKAAVLPFARFAGADPVLGPEMRSTGEVMATAADLPTAFAKAERAAGRPLPTSGRRVPLRPRRRQAEHRADRGRARRSRLRPRRHGRDGAHAPCRRARGRGGREGGRCGPGRADGRRPDPRASLQRRRQHAAGLGGARRRLLDPRGCARRPCSVHHDRLRCSGSRPCDRQRPRGGDDVAAGADRASPSPETAAGCEASGSSWSRATQSARTR